jgi:hypothetical protein
MVYVFMVIEFLISFCSSNGVGSISLRFLFLCPYYYPILQALLLGVLLACIGCGLVLFRVNIAD